MLQEWRGSWGDWRRFIGLLRGRDSDEAGHSFIPPVILPSHVSFYGGRGSLSPYRRDGSCEPSYAFYDTLLWNVFGNIALTPAYQLYGDLPSLLNSR